MANAVRGKSSSSTSKSTSSSSSISSSGGSSGSSGGSSGGVVNGSYAHAGNDYLSHYYTGGIPELDAALQTWSDRYFAAREAGDAVGMRNANDEANKLRNQYGYAAEFANEDIAKIANQSQNTAGAGGSGAGSGGWEYNTWQQGSGGSLSGVSGLDRYQAAQLEGPTDYSEYIEAMNKAQQEAALSQLKAAYDKNVAALDRAEADIAPKYQEARNQTAGSSELAKRQFAEYAAAQGLNSGAGAQAELARQNTLQGNLNQLNRGEADALADLALQRSQAESDYNNAIAKAQAEGNYTLASQLYQEKVRLDEALREMQLQQAQLDYQSWQSAYQLYRDQVSDSRYADQLAYDRYRDQVLDNRYADELAYDRGRDQIADQRYEDELAYDRDQDQYDREAEKAALLAGVGDFSGYSALWGLSEGQTEALVAQYAAQQQTSQQEAAMDLAAFYAEYGDFSKLKALGVDTGYLDKVQSSELADLAQQGSGGSGSKGSSGGSGSKGSSGGSAGGSSGMDYEGLFQAALASGRPKSFIANNYKKYGFTSSTGLYDDYGDWEYEQGRSAPSFSTYQEAASYLKGKGLSSGGLMTASEWARHKSNPADTSGAASYASYQAYLQGYVNSLLTFS